MDVPPPDLSGLLLGPEPDFSGQPPEVVAILTRTAEVTKSLLSELADQVDAADMSPLPQMEALAETGLLGLHLPPEMGGAGGGEEAGILARLITAAGCGVTTFILLQHLFATKTMQHLMEEAGQPLLPECAELTRMEWLTGVCLAHLGRRGEPRVRAEIEGDEIRFKGEAPWMTGWGLIRRVLVGGRNRQGQGVIALADLEGQEDRIQVVSPYRLQVMEATRTVAPVFRDFRVPRSRLVAVINDAKQIDPGMRIHLDASGCSLGVGGAANLRLHRRGEQRADETLKRASAMLAGSLADMWRRLWALATDPKATLDERQLCRAECNLLSNRVTYALIASEGGSADLVGNTANRLFREAFAYTFNAHTPSFRDALLMGLVRDL
ncbi:MAG: acyl-CoA dehydrogenase family protein [Verrucomicrobiota bacterium]